MVSFKKLFCFKCILAVILLAMPAHYATALELGWLCIIGQTRCCINGKQSCCEDNGMIYDTSCGGGCRVGSKEYNYTASGECDTVTKTRTCCSDGTWSGWNQICPLNKTCPTASKPSTSTTCYGGKNYRTVTCDKTSGTWQTGAWGSCDCSDSAFHFVTMRDGGKCCERIDGTGAKCATNPELSVRWRLQTNGASCNMASSGSSPDISCGTCTENDVNWECTLRRPDSTGNFDCSLYICQW